MPRGISKRQLEHSLALVFIPSVELIAGCRGQNEDHTHTYILLITGVTYYYSPKPNPVTMTQLRAGTATLTPGITHSI